MLTDKDYIEIAKRNGINDYKLLKTVVKVETGGKTFITTGKPYILFEGHVFWKQLQYKKINPAKYVKCNENILYKKYDKSKYKGGLAEYNRLNQAIKINEDAAYNSISSGIFQIMGFNHLKCGYPTAKGMFLSMCKSEINQLQIGAYFIYKRGLTKYLNAHNWSKFAYYYNGPAYKTNNYDVKLEKYYKSL